MRRIPDIIIVVGVIVGAVGFSMGSRWVGGIGLGLALIVGWKRDWCMESFEGMMSSVENSAVNWARHSRAEDSGGADADGNDEN